MFKTTKGAFLRSLETAAKFTLNHKDMPILKYLKIDGKNGKVYATDLECEAVCNFKCDHSQQVQVDEITIPDFRREDLAELTVKQLSELMGPESKGKKKDEIIEFILKFQGENPIKSEKVIEISDEFMVDASLIKIVKALPIENEDEITIKIVDHYLGKPLGITFNDIKAVFVNQVDIDDFPSVRISGFPDFVCEITGSDVTSVAKACTTNKSEKRVHMISLYIDAAKGMMCGCDGKRLHTRHIESCGKNIMIPVFPMRKIATISTGKIMIGESKGISKIVADGNTFLIMNNQGEYPNYEIILNSVCPDKAEFETVRLVESLKQAVAMTSSNFTGIIFDINNEGAKISYVNPERGELEIEGIPCSIGIGIKAQFAVDPLFVMDAISLSDEHSIWSISKQEKGVGPIVISHGEFKNVVMPMKH